MQAQTTMASPLGPLTLLADETGLLGVWFQGQKYFGGQFDLTQAEKTQTPQLLGAKRWLQAYFAGQPLPPAPALHLTGTPYRQRVLTALTQIPFGQVVTYQQLAIRVGQAQGHPSAARAIGGAVGHNPLSIVVPCHRVVGQSGALVGYAGGLARKAWLLTHEGQRVDLAAGRLVADAGAF